MRDTLSSIVGLVGGVTLSVTFWYVTRHVLVPKVEFSQKISKRFAADGTAAYEFQLRNRSRYRGVVDVQFTAKLVSSNVAMWNYWKGDGRIGAPIPMEIRDVPFLSRKDGFRIIRLDLQQFFETVSSHYRRALVLENLNINSPELLESLLKVGDDTFLILEALAYDSWSGSRKYYRSPAYRIDDIVNGRFTKEMSVTPFLKPENEPIE